MATGFTNGKSGKRECNRDHDDGKSKNKKRDDPVPSPSPVPHVAGFGAVDNAAGNMATPSAEEGSNSALYGLLALIPVAGIAIFVVLRRSHHKANEAYLDNSPAATVESLHCMPSPIFTPAAETRAPASTPIVV
jgi:hypothetical protein